MERERGEGCGLPAPRKTRSWTPERCAAAVVAELYLSTSSSWLCTSTVSASRASSPNMQFLTITLTASALLLSTASLCSAGFAASEALQHTEHEQQEHKHEGMPYNFGYGVVSHKHGVDFGQQEHSDGHTVTGHYRVKLPDGRTQVVTYTADWNKGYNAHVQYEGHAAHPQTYQQPQHQQVYQHEEVSQEHAGLTEGASLGGSEGYTAGESYGSQESQGHSEHSSGY